jgi:hypothetical protein
MPAWLRPTPISRLAVYQKAFSDHGEFIADLHKAVTKLSTKKVKRPRK